MSNKWQPFFLMQFIIQRAHVLILLFYICFILFIDLYAQATNIHLFIGVAKPARLNLCCFDNLQI